MICRVARWGIVAIAYLASYLASCLASCLASIAVCLAASPNNADPALATWFRSLKAPNGTACCTVADCRRATHRVTTNGYEVMIDDEWVAVPWERVLRRTDNPTGEAVVCRVPGTTLILCFVRPPDI
jgi:hypothetical protein